MSSVHPSCHQEACNAQWSSFLRGNLKIMTLYQRGPVWWYEFVFRGQRGPGKLELQEQDRGGAHQLCAFGPHFKRLRFGDSSSARISSGETIMEAFEKESQGAEKSPRNVGLFVLALLVAVVVGLGLVLLVLHHHAPVVQQ